MYVQPFLQQAAATCVLEIMVHSYSNPLSTEFGALQCESNDCDNMFTFCLKEDVEGACSLEGLHVTATFDNSDDMNFEGVSDLGNGVTNPVTYTGVEYRVR